MPARLSSGSALLDYALPRYRYYPTKLLKAGTRDWARVQFLQACERLGIPDERWPKFEKLELPAPGGYSVNVPAFTPPSFDVLRDGATDWRRIAERAFRKHCDGFLKRILKRVEDSVSKGVLKRIEQPKGEVPLALRYEWAARRYCLGVRYKDLATTTGNKYNDIAIRQTVTRVLSSVGLSARDKRLG